MKTAEDVIDDLNWECKRYGFPQKKQAELLGITPQAVNKHYRMRSFSFKQYWLIKTKLDDIKGVKE